jgi:ADP-ribose pyrophosphatase YjhB (NUDIX family)
MHTELEHFLATHECNSSESASWRGGQIELTINSYLTADPPPDLFVTSSRCVIVADNHVLVMTNPAGEHILPGGRRGPGEPLERALAREVHEETGLTIPAGPQIAVFHYHHKTPRPVIYPYPYPDFLNVIHVVRLAETQVISVADTYELEGVFVPIDSILETRLPANQWHLLNHIVTATPDQERPQLTEAT